MLKALSALALLAATVTATLSEARASDPTPNLSATANLKDGVMLEGYDPVSYFKSEKPLPGSKSIVLSYGGVKYQFASEANRDEFLKSPEKYQPAYEGWCATAVASGSKYQVDPTNYKVTGGRLFLFYKGWKGDAKKAWLKDETNQMHLADKNWPTVRNTKE